MLGIVTEASFEVLVSVFEMLGGSLAYCFTLLN